MISTVYMTVGIAGSGKSSWATNNADKLEAVVLSSDKIREDWYGDASIQKDNARIFEYIYKTAKQLLKDGNNVIIDATNISQKRRVAFNQEFKNFNRVAVYFSTPYDTCIMLDSGRERTVGKDVIKKMFHNLKVPTYAEGWNDVKIIHYSEPKSFKTREMYENMLLNHSSYQYLFETMNLCYFPQFMSVYGLPQDNPHHTFSVSRHMYHVYDYVYKNYNAYSNIDKLKMLWFSLLHDIGKGCTKTFKDYKGEETKYAHFYNHENCSAQIAVQILHALGYDDDFILDVAELCQQHMKLMNGNEKSERKLRKLVGEDMFNKLLFFKEADMSAK